MELTQCPYDGTAISVETLSGGSLLLRCSSCEAAWERHGVWIGRLRPPDRHLLRAARARAVLTRESTG
jgi:hypothetical protein